jgi:thiamine monophosphate synthase
LKAKDAEAIKAARPKRDADGALTRDGFKSKEIQDLQAASVAQRKKVEALQYRLVADSGDEGKALIEKIKSLEARYEELRK